MNKDRRNLYIPQDENETKRVCGIVKGILLSKCVEIFSSFEDDSNQVRFRKNEVPPKDAIVYLQEYENPEIAAERYEKTGILPETKNINAWHLEKGTLELLDDPNIEADQKDKNIRAMYYKQATFRIKIDIDNAQGFLDFTMGPLFGRGFVVDIMGDTNAIYIGPAKLRWMS